MFRSIFRSAARFQFGRWCGILAALACFGPSSCANLALYRENEFRDIEPSDYVRQVRSADSQGDFFGVSNKSHEIERNLGQ